MVFVTDGFIEWADGRDQEFGQNRLKAVVRTNRRLSAGAIISALYSAVLEFAGTQPQLDDLTVVIIKRTS